MKELGWQSIEGLILKRKLDKHNWAQLSLMECMSATGMMKGQWKSAYSGEITNALQKCKIESVPVHDKSAVKNIKLSIEMYEMGKINDVIEEQKKHSLRCFPAYPHGM